MKKFILKFTTWLVLVVTIVICLVILSLIFFISVWIKNANLTKLILLDFGLVIVAGLVLISGIGCFEFMRSLLQVEKEVDEIERRENTPTINRS